MHLVINSFYFTQYFANMVTEILDKLNKRATQVFVGITSSSSYKVNLFVKYVKNIINI